MIISTTSASLDVDCDLCFMRRNSCMFVLVIAIRIARGRFSCRMAEQSEIIHLEDQRAIKCEEIRSPKALRVSSGQDLNFKFHHTPIPD